MNGLTENPEHEAYLDVGHEYIGRSEGCLQKVLHLFGVELLSVVGKEIRRDVERHWISLLVQSERRRRQKNEETHVRKSVRYELRRRTSQRISYLQRYPQKATQTK